MQDLTVIYRMCGIASTNPSPFYQENKYKLNEVCLKSFIQGFKDISYNIHFILDYCSSEYDELLKHSGLVYTSEHSEAGINQTMLKSYDLATKTDGYVLFQECDYLYRPNIGKAYIEALESLDIVSPYDHKNFYTARDIHKSECNIELIGDTHFRTTERNTMTWGTHSDVIKNNYDTFVKHGYLDDQIWFDLWLAGYKLWVPIPSFATHCVSDYMSPSVNWEELWKIYQ